MRQLLDQAAETVDVGVVEPGLQRIPGLRQFQVRVTAPNRRVNSVRKLVLTSSQAAGSRLRSSQLRLEMLYAATG